jgi:hypothetical protein
MLLTAAEAAAVLIDDEDDLNLIDPDRAFVGKVLAPNVLHIEMIKAAMRPAWGNPKGLIFNHAGDNLFVVVGSQADRGHVMEGSPWAVGKHVVLIKKFDANVPPTNNVFDWLAIWARILALPSRLMNSTRGLEIAKPIGSVKKIVANDLGRYWGPYMRIRVEVAVNNPLFYYVTMFSNRLQTSASYDVQYECLPFYCFSCGLLGHSCLVCPTPAERDENGDLPYTAKRLVALDENARRSGGSKFGTNSTSAGGENSVPGSRGSNSSAMSSGRGRGIGSNHKTGQGEDHEVSSPVENARGRGHGRSTWGRGKGRLDTTKRDLLSGKGTKHNLLLDKRGKPRRIILMQLL